MPRKPQTGVVRYVSHGPNFQYLRFFLSHDVIEAIGRGAPVDTVSVRAEGHDLFVTRDGTITLHKKAGERRRSFNVTAKAIGVDDAVEPKSLSYRLLPGGLLHIQIPKDDLRPVGAP